MFSCALRHGIMPNLFDKLNKPRYNCRDACWWYIKAIKDYMEFTNNEDDILNETVEMRFLDDNQNEHYLKKEKGERKILKVADVVHTIFEVDK